MIKYLAALCIALAGAMSFNFGCGGGNNELAVPQTDAGPLADGGTNGSDCGGTTCTANQVCNELRVCVNKPTENAIAYIEKGEAVGAPDISCYVTTPQKGAGPEKVKVTGCVDVFGLASNTIDLEVTYYLDSKLDTPIAGPIVAVDNAECESSGYHEVENIPTNTLLVRKVACPASMPDCGFKDSWQFNIYLDAATAAGGVISEAANDDAIANVVSEATWLLIPRTVGLSSGVKKGYGVVAGRVRDCNHNPVMNAMVGMTLQPTLLAYFNGMEGKLDDQGEEKASDPDPARTTTNSDGLYAGIEIPVGDETVSALAQVDGALQSLGTFKVAIFGNSISILSFKGARPVAQQ
jgi:hypothetical protein